MRQQLHRQAGDIGGATKAGVVTKVIKDLLVQVAAIDIIDATIAVIVDVIQVVALVMKIVSNTVASSRGERRMSGMLAS